MGRVWRYKRLKPDAYIKMKAEVLKYIMEHDDFTYTSIKLAFGGVHEEDLNSIIFELAGESKKQRGNLQ